MDAAHRHLPPSPYQLFMLMLCIGVLVGLGFAAVADLDPRTRSILEYIDTAVCAIFFADFVAAFWRAENKAAFMRLGWIDLVSSIPFAPYARLGRAVRLFRIARVLRGIRSLKILAEFILARRGQGALLAAALLGLLLVTCASIAMLALEVSPDANIKTAEDALWWAMVTITTVGYGDRFPVSSEGRVLAGIVMLAGVCLVGTFSGLAASWFLAPQARHQDAELEALRAEIAALREAIESRAI
jgi:voltage-gated potassium channel